MRSLCSLLCHLFDSCSLGADLTSSAIILHYLIPDQVKLDGTVSVGGTSTLGTLFKKTKVSSQSRNHRLSRNETFRNNGEAAAHSIDMQTGSVVNMFKFVCAIITRALFILVSLTGVWRVTWVKNDPIYWLLTWLFLPLVIEMIITLKRRKGQDYKWFSPPIFLFLISIIPSIWILELSHRQDNNSDPKCNKLDSWENLLKLVNRNETVVNQTSRDYFKIFSAVCSNDWILALHQILLILLIVGKWLLPLGGGVTRDELSQLLLIFVGTAADILEFTSETLSDVKESSPLLVYIILAVWTWSMLQFPLHLAVVNSKQGGEGEEGVQKASLLTKHSTDMWSIAEALFIQDGPFLVVRLTVMTYFNVFHQMLVFFAIKNFLVVILNLYRLVVLCQDFRTSGNSVDRASSGDPVL